MVKKYSLNSNQKINQNMSYLKRKLSKSNPELLGELTNALVKACKGKIEPCKMVIESQDNAILIYVTGQSFPRYYSGKLTATLADTLGVDFND